MKYECQLCGACCSPHWIENSTYAAAIMRPEEFNRIADKLNIPVSEMLTKYEIQAEDGHMRLTERPCRFLCKTNELGQRLCSIHDFKPIECLKYPAPYIFNKPDETIFFAGRCPGLFLEHSDMPNITKAWEQLKRDYAQIAKDTGQAELEEQEIDDLFYSVFAVNHSTIKALAARFRDVQREAQRRLFTALPKTTNN